MTDTRHAYICDTVRTPIGRFGGSLSLVRADDLAAVPIKALTERAWPSPAIHALEARGGRRALCTLCVGVGQGVALAIERL
jgi:acetyl-CoA acetyltransferase